MNKTVRKLVLTTFLVAAAMTLSSKSEAGAGKFCDYQYFYDAAHTQPAGYCNRACYAGGNVCLGDVTEYYELVDCSYSCNP
jgi:hypothetical protein